MKNLIESLLDDDLVSKVNKKFILVGLLKDILNSKNKSEFYNNRNKLLSVISNNNPSPLTFGNQEKWEGHMRKAIYISWDFGEVRVDTTYGFNGYSSTVDYTFELPKELLKEYRVLYKNAE